MQGPGCDAGPCCRGSHETGPHGDPRVAADGNLMRSVSKAMIAPAVPAVNKYGRGHFLSTFGANIGLPGSQRDLTSGPKARKKPPRTALAHPSRPPSGHIDRPCTTR